MAAHRFKLLLIAAVIVIVAAGGYVYWWTRVADSTQSIIAGWTAQMSQKGWLAQTGDASVSGFPFNIRIALPEPALADPAGNSWQGPALTLVLSPFALRHVHLEAPGRHTVALADRPQMAIDAASATADITLAADGAIDAQIALGKVQWAEITFDQLDLAILAPATAAAEYTPATAASMSPNPNQVGLSLQADLANLVLPARLHVPLEGPVTRASLTGRLLGLPPATLGAESVAKWSAEGGVFEIDSASVSWPPLAAQGNGTLAFDKALQPLVSGTVTGRGVGETLKILAKAGIVNPDQAQMAGLAFGLLSRPGADGAPELTLPVSIQNRVLSLGPVALAKMPELKW